MIPRKFEFYKAKSLDEAIDFLDGHEDAKVIAGGQSLIPLMKLRIVSPKYLVDIGGLEELKYIREGSEGELRIGALVTHSEIEESKLIRGKWPVLAKTATNIADVQIRSRGTIGGSLCHADPAADYPPTLLILNSKVVVRGKGGRRTLSLEDFIIGPFTTDLRENEILEEVIVPPYDGSTDYVKFARREGDLAVVNVAALMRKEGDKIADLRVAIGGASFKAMRLKELEESLKGGGLEDLEQKVDEIVKGLDPPSDVHGSAEYRREVARVLLRRIITNLYRGETIG